MAKVARDEVWLLETDAVALRPRLLDFLRASRMRVIEETADRVLAGQGSYMWTRLLGGWFVSPAQLPKRATVTVAPQGRVTQVHAHIEDGLDMGFMNAVLQGRFERYFEAWLSDLGTALGAVPEPA